jgi:hypothetical protein
MDPASRVNPLSQLLTQVQQPRKRLLVPLGEAEIEEIETQHQDLVSAYQKLQTLKACLDSYTELGEKFTLLRDFAGGFATVFPSSTTVDSDFSLCNWEKNKVRSALIELPLEGILQYKQYEAVLNQKATEAWQFVAVLNNR